MALSFNQIPINLRTPGAYIEIDNSAALRGLPGMPSRILVIGQRLAAGTVAEAVPTRVLDEDEAEAFFGRGSMLHLMFRALKANNDWTETWAVALDDLVAGVTAAGTVSFGGAVTTAGTLNLYIAGQRVRVGVATTDAAADVATNVAAAIVATSPSASTAAATGESHATPPTASPPPPICRSPPPSTALPTPRSTSPPGTRAKPATASICASIIIRANTPRLV